MDIDDINLTDASIKAQTLSNMLMVASVLTAHNGNGNGVAATCYDVATSSLRQLAAIMGYRLEKIEDAQAAHEAAIARRVAEDRDYGQQDITTGR